MTHPSKYSLDRENPWPGLESYTETAHSYFHGRDEAVDELQRRVKAHRLTVLFGESGLGKTSLLRAGLFPKLRNDAFLPVYVRLEFSSNALPLSDQVKHQLGDAIREAKLDATEKLEYQPSAWQWLHLRNSELCDDFGRDVIPVLVFDQFEEIFTLGRSAAPGLIDHFIEELGDLAENRVPAELEALLDEDPSQASLFDFRRSDFRVLLSLREDYLPDLEGLRSALPSLMQNRMRLTRLNGQQALDAVLKPGGSLITREVAIQIVRSVSAEKDGDLDRLEIAPPLLSLVCRELNQRRQAKGEAQITATLLEGTRSEILGNFYERCMAGMAPAVRAFVEDELLTDSGNRDSVTIERARRTLTQSGAPTGALDHLIDSRLLRVDERFGVSRIELTHDVLTGIVMTSRQTRRTREEREKLEAQRLSAEASARIERQKFRRLLLVTFTMVAITIAAIVFGFAAYRAKQEAAGVHYYTAIALAFRAWNDGDVGTAREQVNEAAAAVSGLRWWNVSSWELSYMQGLTELTSYGNVASPQQQDYVDAIAFVPGSNSEVAIGTGDGAVKLVDVRTGKDIRNFVWQERVSVGFSFSQRKDGALQVTEVFPNTPARDEANLKQGDLVLAIGTSDGSMQDSSKLKLDDAAKLLHGPTGTTVRLSILRAGTKQPQIVQVRRKETLENFGHRDAVLSLAFSKDGTRLLSGGADDRLVIWDVDGGKGINEIPVGTGVTGIAYSPDNNYLAVSFARDRTVQVLRPSDNAIMPKQVSSQPVCHFAFSPDGRQIAVAAKSDNASRVLVWTFALAGKEPLEKFEVAGSTCDGVAFSPDGRRLAVLAGGYIQQFDRDHPRAKPVSFPDQSYATAFAFSPDGRYIATTGSDGEITVWDAANGSQLRVLRGHTAPALAVAFSPDENTLVTGGMDKTIRAWDLRRKSQRAFRWQSTDQGQIAGVALSPDGRFAVATSPFSDRPTVRLYDAATWRELSKFPAKTAHLNFSPDGEQLAIPDEKGTIRLVDVRTGQVLKTLKKHQDAVNWLEFSPDGRQLGSASQDGSALLWDISSGAGHPLPDHSGGRVTAITFSPNGRFVATGSPDDRAVRLFDSASGRKLWRKDTRFGSYCLRFTPDSKFLLSGELGGRLSLWRVSDGKLSGELAGHTSMVDDAAFSPDGRRLVTVSEDHTTRLWNVPQMRELFELQIRDKDFDAAAFSPDGLRLITAGYDNFRFWDAALLSGNPTSPTAAFYLARGISMSYLGRWETAVNDLTQGLALEPKDDSPLARRDRASILTARGDSEANKGDWDRALQDFGAALALTPDDTELRYRHAVVSLHQTDANNFEADRSHLLEQAIRTRDEHDENLAGWVCSFLPARNGLDLGPIRELDRKLVAANQTSYPYVSTYASLLCRAGRIDDCLKELTASMALKKHSDSNPEGEPDGTPYDWVFMALAYAQQGHPNQARTWLKYAANHIERVASDPLYDDPNWSWDWEDKVLMEVLQKEVQGVIKQSRPATTEPVLDHQASPKSAGQVGRNKEPR